MADDFKALVTAQKETTRMLMTSEERAEADRLKEEQHKVRVEAGRKAWESRQNKNAENTKKDNDLQISFLGNIKTGFSKFFTGGSKAAEIQERNERQTQKLVNGIKTMSGYLKGLASQAVERVRSGLGGLKKFALGALALAALSFLNSPNLMRMVSEFVDVIIPKLAHILDKYIIPFGILIKDKLVKLFKDTVAVFDGEKGIISLLEENYDTLIGLSALLFPGILFGSLKAGIGLMMKGISLAYTKAGIAKLLATPAVSGALGLAGIATGLSMAINDGFNEYSKSKDISKSIAAGLAGEGKGMENALKNAGKFASMFAGFGLIAFGPIGAVIGGAIGAVIGGFLGFFGKDAVDKALNTITDKAKQVWSDITSIFTNLFLSLKKFLGFELEKEQEESLKSFESERDAANKRRELKQIDRQLRIAKEDADKINKGVTIAGVNFGGESEAEQLRDRQRVQELLARRSRLEGFEGSVSEFNRREKNLRQLVKKEMTDVLGESKMSDFGTVVDSSVSVIGSNNTEQKYYQTSQLAINNRDPVLGAIIYAF